MLLPCVTVAAFKKKTIVFTPSSTLHPPARSNLRSLSYCLYHIDFMYITFAFHYSKSICKHICEDNEVRANRKLSSAATIHNFNVHCMKLHNATMPCHQSFESNQFYFFYYISHWQPQCIINLRWAVTCYIYSVTITWVTFWINCTCKSSFNATYFLLLLDYNCEDRTILFLCYIWLHSARSLLLFLPLF